MELNSRNPAPRPSNTSAYQPAGAAVLERLPNAVRCGTAQYSPSLALIWRQIATRRPLTSSKRRRPPRGLAGQMRAATGPNNWGLAQGLWRICGATPQALGTNANSVFKLAESKGLVVGGPGFEPRTFAL